ncbi:hypothetical protein F4810DRAFT_718064 [Camillea tinctor]|nr:hypothetical protein F4810DRAFT_718064 [Camillea tinctor]
MNFLFVTVINHEALISCLAKGLVKIADALPVVEVTIFLFTTERMKLALAEIYASKSGHDFIAGRTARYALVAHKDETDDDHTPTDQLKRSLTDLQFSQVLTFLSKSPLENPDKAVSDALLLRNWKCQSSKIIYDPFWLRPRFQAWAQSQKSSLILVKGSFGSRQHVKYFPANAIVCAREANDPAIWALKTMDSMSSGISVVELLKYLTHQTLQHGLPPTERSLSLSCARFQNGRTQKEWFDILAASLANLELIYIAVNVEVLDSMPSNTRGGLSILVAFLKLFDELGTRSPKTVVKVVFASYRSHISGHITYEMRDNVIYVGKQKTKTPRANGKTRGFLSARGQMGRGLIINMLRQ